MRTVAVIAMMFVLCRVGAFAESQSPASQMAEKINARDKGSSKESEKTQINYSIKVEVDGLTPPKEASLAKILLGGDTQNNRQQGEAKEQQNELFYTKTTAWSTALLVIVTGILCWVTWLLKQVAASEFAATHRPKIIIHMFRRIYRDEKTVSAGFTYANIGDTDANIVEIETNIFYSDNIEAEDSAITEKFSNKVLKAGGKDTFTATSNITDTKAIIDGMNEIRRKSIPRIVCVGRIRYAGKQGATRETGFYRVYDASKSCWLSVEGSEYEYSY